MCNLCEPFADTVKFESAAHLERIIADVRELALTPGILKITKGSLEWDDLIDCMMECAACGQRFVLSCETYHGSGGTWAADRPKAR
jgi:hypothetical protein